MVDAQLLDFWAMTGQVLLLDLLLGGDNAVVIAMASQGLAQRLRWRAITLGTALAIVLRVVLTMLAGWVLQLPALKLIGAVLLLVIAVKLQLHEPEDDADSAAAGEGRFWAAVLTIVGADIALSLDNVLALAATSRGHFWVLALGLAASIPILMFGSLWLSRLLQRLPWLLSAGAALLGWVAGETAIGDPLLARLVDHASPWWSYGLPALAAGTVLVLGAGLKAWQSARAHR